MKLDLSSNDLSTVRLALSGWAFRCDSEAREMGVLADTFADRPDLRARCLSNRQASLSFAAEARALLVKLP